MGKTTGGCQECGGSFADDGSCLGCGAGRPERHVVRAGSSADDGWPHAEYTVPDIERRLRARTLIPTVQWAEGFRCGAIDERESGDLSLRAFRDANVARCEEVFFPLKSWSPTDYGCALAGEVGEVCNLLKKMLRGDEVDLRAVEDELADAFSYLDLLAARLGIDLPTAVTRKFNQVSEEKSSSIRLPEAPRGS